MHINAAIVCFARPPQRLRKKIILADHPPLSAQEDFQQIEFGHSQVNDLACTQHLAQGRLQQQIAQCRIAAFRAHLAPSPA